MNLKSKQFNSIQPGSPSSVCVSNDLNFALRKWKKNIKDSKLIEEQFDRKYYVKPSVTKKAQRELARYNQSKVQ